MDRVVIGMDPHKPSVTIEARDTREVLRATGRFGADSRQYKPSGCPPGALSPCCFWAGS